MRSSLDRELCRIYLMSTYRPPRGWPGLFLLLDQHLACTAREREVSSLGGHSVMFDYITGPFQCEPGFRNFPYRNASMGVSIPVPLGCEGCPSDPRRKVFDYVTILVFWTYQHCLFASEWIRSSPADNRYPSSGFLQMLHKTIQHSSWNSGTISAHRGDVVKSYDEWIVGLHI
jgi:hypothetical protein